MKGLTLASFQKSWILKISTENEKENKKVIVIHWVVPCPILIRIDLGSGKWWWVDISNWYKGMNIGIHIAYISNSSHISISSPLSRQTKPTCLFVNWNFIHFSILLRFSLYPTCLLSNESQKNQLHVALIHTSLKPWHTSQESSLISTVK